MHNKKQHLYRNDLYVCYLNNAIAEIIVAKTVTINVNLSLPSGIEFLKIVNESNIIFKPIDNKE